MSVVSLKITVQEMKWHTDVRSNYPRWLINTVTQPLRRLSFSPLSCNTCWALYFNLKIEWNKQRAQAFELRDVIANYVRPSVERLLTPHEPTKEHSDLRRSYFNVDVWSFCRQESNLRAIQLRPGIGQ
jgi:hypothetical protein